MWRNFQYQSTKVSCQYFLVNLVLYFLCVIYKDQACLKLFVFTLPHPMNTEPQDATGEVYKKRFNSKLTIFSKVFMYHYRLRQNRCIYIKRILILLFKSFLVVRVRRLIYQPYLLSLLYLSFIDYWRNYLKYKFKENKIYSGHMGRIQNCGLVGIFQLFS